MVNVQDILGVSVQDIPEPQRSTLIAGLTQLVLLKLVEQLTEKMSPADQSELETMIDNQSTEQEIYDFLQKKFPDIEARAQQIAAAERVQLDQKLQQLLGLINQEKT